MANPNLPLNLLTEIYGSQKAPPLWDELRARLERYSAAHPPRPAAPLTHQDAMLITYGDQLNAPGQPPLAVLEAFLRRQLGGLVTCLHLLPFYPSSSDDGFSVMDYRQVDASLGGWPDISRLGADFRLMFDAVINHASAEGAWFQAFLRGEAPYSDYFITVRGDPDLSRVVRPRTLPLLTRFGGKNVWTTFSADQADLNYANPQVLMEAIDLLLFYAAQGAQFIRLDAIAYLWKQPGTACIHLPQTHAIIRLFRAVLDLAAPQVRLITETNVPHADNISYFGDGANEAQLVYNFALPPLTLHSLATGDCTALSQWAASLRLPSSRTTFFNFLASHDGIGLNPARGLLPDSAIQALVERTLAHHGRVSYKQNPDGSQSPYELNINYFDALSDPMGTEPLELQVRRFMAAEAILLALAGLPGIYFHSLFGSRGWLEGPALTGSNRSINRHKLSLLELEDELAEGGLRQAVFSRSLALLRARRASPAFDPYGNQSVLDCGKAVFGLLREAHGGERAICLQNVSAQEQSVGGLRLVAIRQLAGSGRLVELFPTLGRPYTFERELRLEPYQTLWLGIES